ncbi:MAG: AI-2E family transporter [Desulfofustis sp. PB-SRB1]|jgi:predicted PurR-regulated permease PerM|nr:AI-2E family transporter [Desulfofustis sp. PB-SRB1]HBH29124.1 AI-2E family transporter [Desulfofustis sp.]
MNHNQPDDRSFEKKIIEVVIKISVLFLLIVIAVQIVYPFLMPIAWGIIIAVAVEPLVRIVAGWLGGRRKIVATLFAIVTIGLLLIASFKLASTSVEMAQQLSADLQGEQIVVPPPPDAVQTWPIIGEPVYEAWNLASSNLAVALEKFGPQLRKAGLFLFDTISGGIGQVLLFIISIAISAAFLATAERSTAIATRVVSKFAGTQGAKIIALSTATIRGVMQGVIGVAFIQAVLALIGMMAVGVPAAGVWAVLVLVLAVIQLPPLLILFPIALWVFSFASTVPAVFFLIWALIVSGCDSILKPVLMGRGVDAPMLVILIGALGGMMLSGLIGLFVGAVVLAISYTLFAAWVSDRDPSAP